MRFQFVHAADLHLDSPMRGLERYEGAPVERIRGATRRALANLVELCLSEGVAFLLVAGDLYDGTWDDYGTGLYFATQMRRLRDAGVRVFIVGGNHDAASRMTRSLKLPPNVHVFPTLAPATETLDELGVAIHGQSYARPATLDNLAARYPAPRAGAFNIGLLHTNADGRPGHDPYAPCTTEGLVGRGYDYWALGHVHQREVLCDRPYVLFPGNLQGRNAREAGPKGATLVTVDEGRVVARHRTLDDVRWARVIVDATHAASGDDVVDLVREGLAREILGAEDRWLVVPVLVEGTSRAHATLASEPDRWINEVRAAAADVGRGQVWIERVRLETTPSLDGAAIAGTALGGLVESLRELKSGAVRLDGVTDVVDELRKRLKGDRDAADLLPLEDPAFLAALYADAERLLLPRLAAAEAER